MEMMVMFRKTHKKKRTGRRKKMIKKGKCLPSQYFAFKWLIIEEESNPFHNCVNEIIIVYCIYDGNDQYIIIPSLSIILYHFIIESTNKHFRIVFVLCVHFRTRVKMRVCLCVIEQQKLFDHCGYCGVGGGGDGIWWSCVFACVCVCILFS